MNIIAPYKNSDTNIHYLFSRVPVQNFIIIEKSFQMFFYHISVILAEFILIKSNLA